MSDEITLLDVGNGMLILGAIILVCYFVLLLVSYRAAPEAGSGMGNLGNWLFYTIVVSAGLICAGFLLRIFTDSEGT